MACAADSEVDAVTALVMVDAAIAACTAAAFMGPPMPNMPMSGSTAADTRLCVSLTLLSASSISLRGQAS